MILKVSNGDRIPVGAVTYVLQVSAKLDAEMRDENCHGTCNKRTCEIQVRADLAPERFMEVLCHEVAHGINNEYCNSSMTEDQVHGCGEGIAQVLRGWGVEMVIE